MHLLEPQPGIWVPLSAACTLLPAPCCLLPTPCCLTLLPPPLLPTLAPGWMLSFSRACASPASASLAEPSVLLSRTFCSREGMKWKRGGQGWTLHR